LKKIPWRRIIIINFISMWGKKTKREVKIPKLSRADTPEGSRKFEHRLQEGLEQVLRGQMWAPEKGVRIGEPLRGG